MNIKSTVTLNSGSEMPIIGIGSWELTDQTADIITRGINMGFRLIDTSGDYGTQTGVGEGIKSSGISRDQVFLTTKVEETDDTYQSTRDDLDELGMTYANLMLLHRPPRVGFGRELWEGLIRAKQDGLAKDIGVSNYSVEQIQSLIDATGVVPSVNQIEWSPFGHSLEMLGYCQENGIILQAYSPLTRGERLDDPEVNLIAASYAKSPSQILLKWSTQLGVVPIVKAGNLDHLEEDANIFDFELDDSDMIALQDLNEDYSALGEHLSYI